MQIINEPQNALSQATQGIQWAYPNLTWVPNTFGCYDSNFQDDQIPLIAGGGQRSRSGTLGLCWAWYVNCRNHGNGFSTPYISRNR